MKFSDYEIEYWKDAKGHLRGKIPDLPGSDFTARNQAGLEAAARQAIGAWVDRAEKLGMEIPARNSRGAFSGVLRIRVAKSMHRQLLDLCEAHDVAISNLVTAMLGAGLDWLEGELLGVVENETQRPTPPPPVALVRKRRIDYSGTLASGSWTQNIPIELHQRLHLMAGAENVGINLLANLLLTRVLRDFNPVEEQPKVETTLLRLASA